MNNYIEVVTTTGDKLLLNINFISELLSGSGDKAILVMSNGNQYKLISTYKDIKCRLHDMGRPMAK